MIATVLATAAIAVLAMLPGLILTRGLGEKPGQRAAAATASLVTAMLATALLGELASLFGMSVPILAFPGVSLAGCGASWLATRNRQAGLTGVEWPGFCLALLFVGYGLLTQALAVRDDSSGALLIHAWFNADWFKHLGHVAALADFGVPARDAFNNGAPLHYYWLSYVLPAAGAAIGGDNWAALNTANTLIVGLFCLNFYGTVRIAASTPAAAFASAFLCLFICAPTGFFPYLVQPSGIDILLNWPNAPKSPALITLAQYIPQHALTVTTLLAWILLNRPDAPAPRSVRLLALSMLACALTLSTLLGAVVLGTYGLVSLWERRLKAVPEVAAMAVLSGLLVLALAVIQWGAPNSALDSPLWEGVANPEPWFVRAVMSAMLVVGNLGLPLLLAAVLLRFWKPEDDRARFAWRLAVVTIAAGIGAAAISEVLMSARVATEMRIRAVNIPAIGIALVGGWAISHQWAKGAKARLAAAGVAAMLTLVALPSAVVNTVWHWQVGDIHTTVIPRDDRAVLAFLKRHSDRRAIVWQYPEPPVLANPPGDDAWAVVLGGRTVTGSLRATDYASTVKRVQAAERYFAGEDVPVPAEADWIYLSRTLHPGSYDLLAARLGGEPAWQREMCLKNACLFSRAGRGIEN